MGGIGQNHNSQDRLGACYALSRSQVSRHKIEYKIITHSPNYPQKRLPSQSNSRIMYLNEQI
jgi:hypothetical protein